MKVFKWVVASMMMGAISFSAMAAKEVTKEEVKTMNLQKIGTVNTTAETTSPMDAKKVLSKLADEKGGNPLRLRSFLHPSGFALSGEDPD